MTPATPRITPLRPSDGATPAARGSRLIAALVGLLLAGGLAAGAGAMDALHRPLWLDEVVTQLEVHSPRGILHAMMAGVDFHPPVYAALASWCAWIAGAASPVAVRMPSLIAAVLTVVVFGASLRARHSLPAAIAGVLALSSHPLFLAQVFEARPYALWIFGCLLAAEALREGRPARARLAATAAAVLCSVHYFGIVALATMAVGATLHSRLVRSTSSAAALRDLLPLATGGMVFAALLPLARIQLAAIGGRSWVTRPTLSDIDFFLRFPWAWRPLVLLILAGGAFVLLRRLPLLARFIPRPRAVTLDATEFALLALALIPPGLVVVSLLFKPVLVLRYSAPAALAVATLCAIAVDRLPSYVRWLAVVWLVRVALFSFTSTGRQARDDMAQLAEDTRAVQWLARGGIATIAPLRHDAYRVSLPLGDAPAVAWLIISDHTMARVAALRIAGLTESLMAVERDFGRSTLREFDFPAVMEEKDVRALPAVALMRDRSLSAADSIWLPGFRYQCSIGARVAVYAAPGTVATADAGALQRPCQSATTATGAPGK